MFYKTFFGRFVWRRDWHRRVRMRLGHYRRKLTKDVLIDLKHVFRDKSVETILDVGANIGFVTHQFQKMFPGAQIYAFEPNPKVFEVLAASYAGDNRVKIVNCGVGDVKGKLSFNVNANTGTSSFLTATEYHRKHQARRLLDPIDVEVLTLDHFTEAEGLPHIDILKLDIEGYELRALQGAARLLKGQAIDAIYTEVCLVPQYVGQPLLHEITSFLESYGYFLYNLDDFIGQETPIRQAVLGNATYISASFRDFLTSKYGSKNCGW